MVLSLFDACRVGIRNALENGIPLPVHKLPLHFRQPILDMVLMSGTINEPACIAMLSSTQFLTGSSSLNTLCGLVNDRNFLHRVAMSLATIGPDGKTLGFSISELHLNLYYNLTWKTTNLTSVVQLIAQCPRLAKLEFHTKLDTREEIEEDNKGNILANSLRVDGGEGPGLLNSSQVWNPCFSVLENLEEFNFIGWRSGFFDLPAPTILKSGYDILKFKRLTSLNLENCTLDDDACSQLVFSLRETLISLHAIGVECGYADNILPISLPKLKSLHISKHDWTKNSTEFIANLKDCSELEYIYLHIGDRMIDDASMVELAGMNAQLEISLQLDLVDYFTADEVVEKFTKSKLIELLGEKLTHLNWIHVDWDQRCTIPLRHLIDKCQNLVSLRFGNLNDFMSGVSPEHREAKLSLAPLFTDKERAKKLRHLTLLGDFEESILDSIFENCVNLDYLQITDCSQLGDHHLRKLAGGGARLSELQFRDCFDITDDGVIPILKSSGSKLTYFLAVDSPGITDVTYKAAFEFCRYVGWEYFRNQELKDLAFLKSFMKVDHLPLFDAGENDGSTTSETDDDDDL